MTGFARVRGAIGAVEVTISVKAVNHRGLDLAFLYRFRDGSVRIGDALYHQEARRRAATSTFVCNWLRRPAEAASNLDKGRLEAYMTAYREAAAQYGIARTRDLERCVPYPGHPERSGRFRIARRPSKRLSSPFSSKLLRR